MFDGERWQTERWMAFAMARMACALSVDGVRFRAMESPWRMGAPTVPINGRPCASMGKNRLGGM
jgi:hypothetical protein